jgi:hypothetical protein
LKVAQARLEGKFDALMATITAQTAGAALQHARVDSLWDWKNTINGTLNTLKMLLWVGATIATMATGLLGYLVLFGSGHPLLR